MLNTIALKLGSFFLMLAIALAGTLGVARSASANSEPVSEELTIPIQDVLNENVPVSMQKRVLYHYFRKVEKPSASTVQKLKALVQIKAIPQSFFFSAAHFELDRPKDFTPDQFLTKDYMKLLTKAKELECYSQPGKLVCPQVLLQLRILGSFLKKNVEFQSDITQIAPGAYRTRQFGFTSVLKAANGMIYLTETADTIKVDIYQIVQVTDFYNSQIDSEGTLFNFIKDRTASALARGVQKLEEAK